MKSSSGIISRNREAGRRDGSLPGATATRNESKKSQGRVVNNGSLTLHLITVVNKMRIYEKITNISSFTIIY